MKVQWGPEQSPEQQLLPEQHLYGQTLCGDGQTLWGAGDTVVNNTGRISALMQFTIYQGQANVYQEDWLPGCCC